jgi:hypothetical protein
VRAAKPILVAMSILAGCSMSACGGGGSQVPSSTSAAVSGGASVLSAEARSLVTGDIPDNQVFLAFRVRRAGYALRYPEGWAQRRLRDGATFADKNNLIRVTLSTGASPTTASVLAELARERALQPTLSYGTPTSVTIAGKPVVKVSYATLSRPNPVTGKRVRLLVDRYVYAHAGKLATLDLGTPSGVDNVDAYRMIAYSFRWL